MASYSKQMIEVARSWLAVNPDPLSPWINIPRFDKNTQRRNQPIDRKRYTEAAKVLPSIVPLVEEIDRLEAEIESTRADVHEKERTVEELVNVAPTPHQGKHGVDDAYRTDIGRWALAWARDGHNVFDLGADFAAAMLLTDARELDIASVRLPFRGLLMLVPDGFARGVEGGHYTKIHITEIHRADITQLEVGNRVADTLKTLSTPHLHVALAQLTAKTEADAKAAGPKFYTKHQDTNDTAFHIYGSDGTHVLDTLIERKGLTWDAFDALPDDVTDDADRSARHTLRQIVFGTLAYIAAVENATELREPAGKPRDRREGTAPKIHDVGRTLRLDPHLVRAARAGSREVALRLKHRHIVRGHYRNQPFGPRRAEVKRIWIAPFWKGPEDGAELVHTYLIDKREERQP